MRRGDPGLRARAELAGPVSRGTKVLTRLATAAWLASPAAPLAADWLVLQDGTRLEVQEGWKVSGRQIVFAGRDGRLSSLRADQIDLAASAAENQRAASAPVRTTAPPGPEPLKAHWSLSDRDFAPRSPASGQQGTESPANAPVEGRPIDFTSGLRILDWGHSVDPVGRRIQILGTLENGGKADVSSIYLGVRLIDRRGVVVAEQGALVEKASLAPGEISGFRVSFPQVAEFESVKFEPTPRCFKLPKNAKGNLAALLPPEP